MTRLRDAPNLAILLDYDGTLVPIARTPDLAVPDDELMGMLSALARRPRTSVHIVSGRPRAVLDKWLGHLPVSLWAEHGVFCRGPNNSSWETALAMPSDWMRKVSPLLDRFTAGTPGSLLETKSASVAWHYRLADFEFGARQAHELQLLLEEALENEPLEILQGKKVIEVRPRGIGKEVVAHHLAAAEGPSPAILAIGDDCTDEDLFEALPPSAVTIAIGGSSLATYHLADVRETRALLQAFL